MAGDHRANLALAMIHKFPAGDPDIARMEAFVPQARRRSADMQAPFFYALGKGRDAYSGRS